MRMFRRSLRVAISQFTRVLFCFVLEEKEISTICRFLFYKVLLLLQMHIWKKFITINPRIRYRHFPVRGIYSYTFDFDTFKNDTFKSVIFRYFHKWLLRSFWYFWRKILFWHFQEWHFWKCMSRCPQPYTYFICNLQMSWAPPTN